MSKEIYCSTCGQKRECTDDGRVMTIDQALDEQKGENDGRKH